MVDHPLDVFPYEVANLRYNFVACDASVIYARVLLIQLLVRQVQLLLMIFLSGVIEVLLIQLKATRVVFDLCKFVIVIIIVTSVIVISRERRVERVERSLSRRKSS